MSVFYSAARRPGLPAEELPGFPGDAVRQRGELGPGEELEVCPLAWEVLPEGSSCGGIGRCFSTWQVRRVRELTSALALVYHTYCPACFTRELKLRELRFGKGKPVPEASEWRSWDPIILPPLEPGADSPLKSCLVYNGFPLFLQSFNRYSLSSSRVPGLTLCTVETAIRKTGTHVPFGKYRQ